MTHTLIGNRAFKPETRAVLRRMAIIAGWAAAYPLWRVLIPSPYCPRPALADVGLGLKFAGTIFMILDLVKGCRRQKGSPWTILIYLVMALTGFFLFICGFPVGCFPSNQLPGDGRMIEFPSETIS